MTIVPFLEDKVFGPQDIQTMSTALEEVCHVLGLANKAKGERELLAHQGERDAALLRDRVLSEIAYGPGEWPTPLVRAARNGVPLKPEQTQTD